MKNKIISYAKKIIKYLDKEYIYEKGSHNDLNWDCPECKAKILKGGLEWLIDIEEFGIKINKELKEL